MPPQRGVRCAVFLRRKSAPSANRKMRGCFVVTTTATWIEGTCCSLLFPERAGMQSHVAHPLKSPSVGVDLFSSIA
ncbi:hypothetical protein T12_2190 [Trichinella patagoniensis]|uniref:Uncharacterized protein n=1 Tax=Trichinella patagoniensis TaxID=990121 RepID=A0A0V1ADY9_9BILA|nr:hypothetical protein T12_2190 [Trichinella patagoniensis]